MLLSLKLPEADSPTTLPLSISTILCPDCKPGVTLAVTLRLPALSRMVDSFAGLVTLTLVYFLLVDGVFCALPVVGTFVALKVLIGCSGKGSSSLFFRTSVKVTLPSGLTCLNISACVVPRNKLNDKRAMKVKDNVRMSLL